MAQGRCAGCGKTGNAPKAIRQHSLTCSQYIELYKSDPSKALLPEEEFIRWTNEENDPESRAVAKDARLTKRFAELDERRTAQSARWAKPSDILED